MRRYAEKESAIIWIYTQFPLAHNKKTIYRQSNTIMHYQQTVTRFALNNQS